MLPRRVSLLLWAVVVLTSQVHLAVSFVHHPRGVTTSSHWPTTKYSSTTARPSAEDPTRQQQQQQVPVDTDAVNGDAAAGLIRQSDAKSQLFASFAALSLSDQYDAVLTGLCAKILDSTDMKEEEAVQALEDPLQLIEEMNEKRIPASARSLMALVDVRVKPHFTYLVLILFL